MPMDVSDVVKGLSDFYYPMTRVSQSQLADIMKYRKLAKGEMLLKEGEVCEYMYWVQKGMIRQFYFKGGKNLTEHFSYEKCMVICLESYLKQEPTRLMAEAIEPSLVWGIPYEEMQHLVSVNNEIEVFYRKIFEYSLIVSQQKADSLRFETAQDRYRILMERHPEIVRRAPLVDIASYLQMTPETLSRVRGQM